jgi:hypothetical protein
LEGGFKIAVSKCNKGIIDYYISNGVRITTGALKKATKNGYIDLVKYLIFCKYGKQSKYKQNGYLF